MCNSYTHDINKKYEITGKYVCIFSNVYKYYTMLWLGKCPLIYFNMWLSKFVRVYYNIITSML